MKAQIVYLMRGGGKPPKPRINFGGTLFRDAGFIPGALVQALPKTDGLDFVLCDDLRGWHYSELDALVKGQGGKLMQVTVRPDKGHEYPALHTEDAFMLETGLTPGDTVAAFFSPGTIQVRKVNLPPNAKLIHTTGVSVHGTDKRLPAVAFNGKWLEDWGFAPNALATISAEPGTLTFRMVPGRDYKTMVSMARRDGSKPISVGQRAGRKGPDVPALGTSGSLVSKAGFNIGDILTATPSPGLIKLQRLVIQGAGTLIT